MINNKEERNKKLYLKLHPNMRVFLPEITNKNIYLGQMSKYINIPIYTRDTIVISSYFKI